MIWEEIGEEVVDNLWWHQEEEAQWVEVEEVANALWQVEEEEEEAKES